MWGRKSRNLSLWVFTNHTTTFYNLAYDTIRDVSNFETIKSCNNADLSSLQETCHSWTLLWPNSTQRILSNPVSEHRRVDSKDLWVDSFWGSTFFLFSYALCEKKRMEYSNVLNQILDSYFLRSLIIFVISYGKSTFPLKLFFTNCRISRYLQQYTNGFKDELRKTMNPEML